MTVSADPSTLWYFAYGSNMARAIFREARRMQPLAAHGGWLEGYRLCFNIPIGSGERGVANLIAEPTTRMHGVVYQLTHEDFERLDASEGVSFGLYRRIPVTIVTAAHGAIEAWTYQSSVASEGRKPSPRYLQLLLDGARENGLPDEYLKYLEALDLAFDERVTP
jgi:cation transport regulator ChaC